VSDLNLKIFSIFNNLFIAPGVINLLQPLLIQRRNIYDTREKKSKMYSWISFVIGLIVSEFPYLCVCAVLYFLCWYYCVKLPYDSNRAGSTFFIMLTYEFIYTGIGQTIAAIAPNATFAALMNPLTISILVLFCGVFVPYTQTNVFWKRWLYYLNPFNYVVSGMLTFGIWGNNVICNDDEYERFDPGNGTCAEYLKGYVTDSGWAINLANPEPTSDCRVCHFRDGRLLDDAEHQPLLLRLERCGYLCDFCHQWVRVSVCLDEVKNQGIEGGVGWSIGLLR
jgi:ABC-type multidrug transport system permease subunit